MLGKKTSTLLALGMIALLCISINYVYAPVPSLFVDPASTIGEGSPAPGSVFTMKVNVSDISSPGLWAYQFFLRFNPDVLNTPVVPLTNRNFTDDASGWTTTATVTSGTETHGYDGTNGNPSPGSGPGSLYHRATSAGTAALVSFTTQQQFTLGPNWPGIPVFVGLSYSYRMTGNAIGTTLSQNPAATPSGTWTNPANAYTSDNAYANASGDGETQQYGTYGITIPANFLPVKVEVGYEAYTAGDEKLGLSVTWDGGTSWAPQVVSSSLGASDPNTVTWVDFTSATSWSSTKLSNTNFRVRVRNVNVDTASNIYLDWIPVRVTISGSSMSMRVITPSALTRTLLATTYIQATPWTYVITTAAGSVFYEPGTYTFRLLNTLRANATGPDKYIQFNWDDIGLFIVPINVGEGAFLKQGGSTDFYAEYVNQSTLYISNQLTGSPYYSAWPVTGRGTVANFSFIVNYGSSPLDLASIQDKYLFTIGDPPTYPTVLITPVNVQDGYFRNALTGDLNGDRQVDSDDLIVLEEAYGSIPGMPKWDYDCDLFADNKIDVKDLRILGKNYGRSIP